MPFLRFSRDKRGYEYFYLLQPAARGERAEPRVLYWFRSPPNIKVGREPFDPALRKALEESNPDIQFNWDAITRTPIPPPSEADHWRERRRALRAAKEAAASEAPGEIEAEAEEPGSEGEPPAIDSGEPEPEQETAQASGASGDAPAVVNPPAEGAERPHRRRRRRRRRGGGAPPQAPSGEV